MNHVLYKRRIMYRGHILQLANSLSASLYHELPLFHEMTYSNQAFHDMPGSNQYLIINIYSLINT